MSSKGTTGSSQVDALALRYEGFTDERLIDRARSGADDLAYDELWRRYRRVLRERVRARGVRADQVEDVAREAFLKALGAFRSPGRSFANFLLYLIAPQCAVDWYRRTGRAYEHEVGLPAQDEDSDPMEFLERHGAQVPSAEERYLASATPAPPSAEVLMEKVGRKIARWVARKGEPDHLADLGKAYLAARLRGEKASLSSLMAPYAAHYAEDPQMQRLRKKAKPLVEFILGQLHTMLAKG